MAAGESPMATTAMPRHAVGPWLRQRDPDLAALRRAGRAAIVMPAMFALGEAVIGNADTATFAAFGSFAMLLLVDFGGPMADRLQALAGLAVVGGAFICLGTLASRAAWLAALAMAVVGFGVIFAGAVSSVLAGATTALLLAFILPVSLAAPASAVPDRLAGWALAAVAALCASALLWPAPAHDRLRSAASAACRALAGRMEAEVAYLLGAKDAALAAGRDRAAERASEAVRALRGGFLGTPYRPTGLSTAARAVVRLVDEVSWLYAIVLEAGQRGSGAVVSTSACAVKVAAAEVLERGADLLDATGGSGDDLRNAMSDLAAALASVEEEAIARLPSSPGPGDAAPPRAGEETAPDLVTSLDPAFRATELGFAVTLIARNIDFTAAAERRSLWGRMLGRQPPGLPSTLSAAEERAAAHVEPHSVWLQNSVRGAAGLGLAVLVARITGVQHSFWVVLGALSVLRSNALSTGEDVARALAGTVLGFVTGAALLAAVGTNSTTLWLLLPVAVFFAGIAPATVSFMAGQAAFTVTLVILFNIIQPAGWRVGLLRLEDIAIGCGVSLVVGLLFWPRGAGPVLRQALAEAYAGGAAYLVSAVRFGLRQLGSGQVDLSSDVGPGEPARAGVRAAAAARRLDQAFRSYLAERGAKPVPMADVTRLVTGIAGLRLAADAVLDLWQDGERGSAGGESAAGEQILATARRLQDWYDDLAGSLIGRRDLSEPLARDSASDARFIGAVRQIIRADDREANVTAVRMIWTSDHLDAARRLQDVLVPAARTAQQKRRSGASARR